jgi:dTDP-4-dehydrorhamnose 3,5-epimerase
MLPDGVLIRRLEPRPDARGDLIEVFRAEWGLEPELVQWNVLRSAPNVLRGVQVHLVNVDSITLVAGHMVVGLHDLRPDSATSGSSGMVSISEDSPQLVTIPVGVAHGFYFAERSITVHGRSHTWDTADELGCRWDDPALGLDWRCQDPVLSDRDQTMGSYDAMRRLVHDALASPVVRSGA